jgi:hypothetical protein
MLINFPWGVSPLSFKFGSHLPAFDLAPITVHTEVNVSSAAGLLGIVSRLKEDSAQHAMVRLPLLSVLCVCQRTFTNLITSLPQAFQSGSRSLKRPSRTVCIPLAQWVAPPPCMGPQKLFSHSRGISYGYTILGATAFSVVVLVLWVDTTAEIGMAAATTTTMTMMQPQRNQCRQW